MRMRKSEIKRWDEYCDEVTTISRIPISKRKINFTV